MTDTHAPARYTRPPVLCRMCGTLLATGLITAGYTTHPVCSPSEKPWAWKRHAKESPDGAGDSADAAAGV